MCKDKHEAVEKEGKNRYITTGYVCAECDTDFGCNELGMNIKDGIQTIACPVCGCNVLYVYQWVMHSDKPFPSPTMCGEVLNLIKKEKAAKIWTDWRIPSDGQHGIDDSLFDEDEVDECCGGLYSSCCQTRREQRSGWCERLQRLLREL